MKQKILPFELSSPSLETLHSHSYRKTNVLYLAILFFLIGTVCALPFIEVGVTSSSKGVLRTDLQNNPLTTIISGQVIQAKIDENTAIQQGDTLLVIDDRELADQIAALRQQVTDNHDYMHDLRTLGQWTNRAATKPMLRTPLYGKQYLSYVQQRAEAELKISFAARQKDRQQQLFASGTIAKAELEQVEFDWDLARQTWQIMQENQVRQWEQDRLQYVQENRDMERQIAQLANKQQHYIITAPVTGNITQSSGLQAGNYVTAGQHVAAISADDDLLVEAYVSPADIGLIREGMPVDLQVDAFNHNQWGLLTGEVSSISNDVREYDGQAFFSVQCRIGQNYLEMKNGYRGYFKKGMTVTTHFQLAHRSLFQLLHDKMEDWLHPTLG